MSDVADEADDTTIRMLDLAQVLARVPLSRTILLELEAADRFPRGRMMSGNRKAWLEHEVAAWMRNCPPSQAGRGGAGRGARRKRG